MKVLLKLYKYKFIQFKIEDFEEFKYMISVSLMYIYMCVYLI